MGSGNSAAECVVDCVREGAQDVDMLVSAPRYFVPKEYMRYYFEITTKLKRLLGIGNTSEMLRDLNRQPVGGEEWILQQKEEEKLIRTLATDMSSYGIETPAPLEAGESVSERRAVIDVGAIPLIKQGRVNVIKGKIMELLDHGACIEGRTSDGISLLKKTYDVIVFATV